MPMSPVENDAGPPIALAAHEIELEEAVRAEGRAYVRYRDAGDFRALSLSPSAAPVDVGRTDACPVRIQGDALVSRRHARLIFEAGWWSVQDAGSHNGTFIGHGRLQGEAILGDGARFRVGDTVLSVHLPPAGPDPDTRDQAAQPRLLNPSPIQHGILVALARPWLAGHEFPVAPSDTEIAHAMDAEATSIAEAVGDLYRQAGLSDELDRRSDLIALAMHERTVSPDDL